LVNGTGDFHMRVPSTAPSNITRHEYENKLVGGARITTALSNDLNASVRDISMQPEQVRKLVANGGGAGGSIFTPESVAKLLIGRTAENFVAPCVRCLHLVRRELELSCDIAATMRRGLETAKTMQNGLLDQCVSISYSLIASLEETALLHVTDLLNMETAFLNYRNPCFLSKLEEHAINTDTLGTLGLGYADASEELPSISLASQTGTGGSMLMLPIVIQCYIDVMRITGLNSLLSPIVVLIIFVRFVCFSRGLGG
jgi:hypothetical protein